jgi:hypothetical protein
MGVYTPGRMNGSQFSPDLHLLWQAQPEVIILLVVGFFIFLFVVVDAYDYMAKHRRLRRVQEWRFNFWHETRNCGRPSPGFPVRPSEQFVEVSTNPAGSS